MSIYQINEEQRERFNYLNKIEVTSQISMRSGIGRFDTAVASWNDCFLCIKDIIWLFNQEEFGLIPKDEIEIVARSICNSITLSDSASKLPKFKKLRNRVLW